MDEDVALAPAAADNSELAPEVRAELLALAQGARETIGKKWSPHTHRAYAGAWSRFVEWTSARGLSSLPADPAILILYLEHLVQEGRAKTTIRTAASAVSAAHRAAGFRGGGNPAAHEDVKNFLRGVEREAPPQRQAAAMMPDVISAIRATARTPRRGRGGRMENSETAEARARVDVALALTLRDGGLRVSEAAALTWKDVVRWADGSGRLTILRSKTDQEGKGAVVAVTPGLPSGPGRHPAGEPGGWRPGVPALDPPDGQPDQGCGRCRRLRWRRLLRPQREGWAGPDDERRRSTHRDHHAPGPVEVGRDGQAVHQGRDGRGSPPVDGRGDVNRAIERVGQVRVDCGFLRVKSGRNTYYTYFRLIADLPPTFRPRRSRF